MLTNHTASKFLAERKNFGCYEIGLNLTPLPTGLRTRLSPIIGR
jgi:hypothetical protein